MKKIVILVGAPGSGKGTQSAFLCSHYSIAHISTGDMLREEIKKETELGTSIKNLLAQGSLVEDSLITKLIKDRITKDDCKYGFVLDGYPRTLKQAELLDDILKLIQAEKYHVIEISLSEDVLIKRITGRYTCSECGSIYNKFTKNPKVEGVCDLCSSSNFIKRDDDSIETLKNRLGIYKKQSSIILDYYSKKGCRHILDGNLTIEKSKEKLIDIVG